MLVVSAIRLIGLPSIHFVTKWEYGSRMARSFVGAFLFTRDIRNLGFHVTFLDVQMLVIYSSF